MEINHYVLRLLVCRFALAIAFSVLMAAMYELKNETEKDVE